MNLEEYIWSGIFQSTHLERLRNVENQSMNQVRYIMPTYSVRSSIYKDLYEHTLKQEITKNFEVH
jgi:hypothetical protein